MNVSLGPRGCIDIKMTFENAPPDAAKKLRTTLSNAAYQPGGGTIHNFVYEVNEAKFTVKGQCYFVAADLENAARKAGFDLAECECSVHRPFDPDQDK